MLREELGGLRWRLVPALLLASALPENTHNRLRTGLLRLGGLRIGKGSLVAGAPRISGDRDLYRNLTIGRNCWVNIDCVLEVHAPVTIEDGAGLGQQTMILTHTHELGSPYRRYASLRPLPVTIRRGAWLGARCVILPGVTVGEGAVVAAGAVVVKDVPPNVMVAGVPARVVKQLD
ncbi:MAG TPA: acyltransferase [Dehalococcoidia bacterium]|nr:acyltransferase [Dehalococcoidia bacterium]